MAILKCKMCGGDLKVEEGINVCECEYCGSKQTIPNVDNEKKLTLFTRANRLRISCEFDKAFGVYESIVSEFPEEAEAYWGLILCKYGIEYVDDPATGKKIPTCHRSSFESIFEDSDFEMVMEYSDVASRSVYRSEAKAIEELRTNILEVSSKEEPYDIFICYKETDENGDRTIDSVLAQDVYDALTEKGYKVFFSRITLEDKLGQEYEPYIFAALNSAKVMLAFGTSYEYYNAVWVKNEWSRYLELIAKGEKKTLIPCYKDIDAYDMPQEFKRLQAQDMGKVGAVQDLLRGIDKVFGKGDKFVQNSVVQQVVQTTGGVSTDALIRRAFMFLEDGNWESADDFCEQVLNIDPENSLAYVGKVMARLQVHHQEELESQNEPFDNNGDYKKAIRFADDKLKEELLGYIDAIKYRNCEAIYKKAVKKMSSARVEADYTVAISEFYKIRDHKDSLELIDKCKELRNEMHVNNVISQAKKKLDNSFTIFEIEAVISDIKVSENIPEIAELIKNAKAEYEERISVSQEIWEDYLSAKSVTYRYESDISNINETCADNNRQISALKKKKDIQVNLRNEINSLNGKIHKANEDIVRLESQLARENHELSGLGFFSLGAKKEINIRIANLKTSLGQRQSELTDLQKRLNSCQKEISSSMSEYDIEQEILSLKRSNELNNEEKATIEQNAAEAVRRLKSVQMKLVTPKFLAVLLSTSDKSLFERVLSDSRIVLAIQTNRKMLEIAQKNSFYDQLSVEIVSQFKRKKGSGLDVEAIYFQACQAMDNPTNDADIIWAKEQFIKIPGYKDSDLRATECNRRTAGV